MHLEESGNQKLGFLILSGATEMEHQSEIGLSLKRQPHKMVKHAQTNR